MATKGGDKMTVDDIVREAAYGNKPSDGMSCPDRALFYELRDIYRDFRSGRITRDEGERRKKDALYRHTKDTQELDRAKVIVQNHADMWRRIEWAAKVFHDLPNLESAKAFVEAVYNCKVEV